jgi:hypothetical protein
MGTAKYVLAKFAGVLSATALFSSRVFGADYTYDYYTSSELDPAAGGLFGAMGVGMIALYCCACLFALVWIGFSIWMLIDVIKRTDTELPNKTMWLVLILLVGGIPAIIYFFGPRKQMDAGKKVK